MFEMGGGFVVSHEQGKCRVLRNTPGSLRRGKEASRAAQQDTQGQGVKVGGRLQAHTGGEIRSESQRVWSPAWPARCTPP